MLTSKLACNQNPQGRAMQFHDEWPHSELCCGLYAERVALADCYSAVVVPAKTRKIILEATQDGQQTISICRKIAQQGVWWPEPSKSTAKGADGRLWVTEYSMTKIGIDVFEINGGDHLVRNCQAREHLPDIWRSRLSTWSWMSTARQRTFQTIRKTKWFRAYHKQSSLPAEYWGRGKNRTNRQEYQPDLSKVLMAYHSTSCEATGFSLAQLMMARNIRTTLLMLEKDLEPKVLPSEVVKDHRTQYTNLRKWRYQWCFC